MFGWLKRIVGRDRVRQKLAQLVLESDVNPDDALEVALFGPDGSEVSYLGYRRAKIERRNLIVWPKGELHLVTPRHEVQFSIVAQEGVSIAGWMLLLGDIELVRFRTPISVVPFCAVPVIEPRADLLREVELSEMEAALGRLEVTDPPTP